MLTKNNICSIGVLIGAVLFSVVYICVFKDSLANTQLLLGGMIFLIFVGILIKYIMRQKRFTVKQLFFYLVLPAILLQLAIGYFMMVEYQTWDVYSIHKNAKALVSGEYFNTAYFARYPNNIALLVIMTGIYAVTNTLFGSTSIYFGVLLNIAAVDFAVYFSIKIAKMLWGERCAYRLGVLCVFFAPLYLYIPIVYTDTICMPFLMAGIFLGLHIGQNIQQKGKLEKRDMLPAVLFGVLLFLGMKLKGSLIILLIAFVIYIFLKVSAKMFLKTISLVLIGFVLMILPYNYMTESITGVTESDYEKYRFPATHWIMMGLDGAGNFNGEDVEFTAGFETYEERKTETKKELLNRIEKLGILGILNQMQGKVVDYGWNYGTFFAERYLGDKGDLPVRENTLHSIVLTNGRYHNIFRTYTQSYYLLIFLFFTMGFWMQLKRKQAVNFETAFLQFILIGILLFFAIWETHPRYIFHVSLVMLLLCAQTWEKIPEILAKTENKFLKNKIHE